MRSQEESDQLYINFVLHNTLLYYSTNAQYTAHVDTVLISSVPAPL